MGSSRKPTMGRPMKQDSIPGKDRTVVVDIRARKNAPVVDAAAATDVWRPEAANGLTSSPESSQTVSPFVDNDSNKENDQAGADKYIEKIRFLPKGRIKKPTVASGSPVPPAQPLPRPR